MTLEAFRLTKEEVWEAIRAQARSQRRGRKPYVIPILAIAVGFLLFSSDLRERISWLAPALLMVVGVYQLIGPVVSSYAAADRFMVMQTKLLPKQYQIDKESVSTKSAEIVTQCAWSAFTRSEETRRLFLLYLPDERPGYVIPKRAFGSEAEVEEARQLFREQIRRGKPRGFQVVTK